MRIEAELHYSAPPHAVAEMTQLPEFQDLKCRNTGALEHTVDIAHRGEHVVITTRRTMPMDNLPDIANAFLRHGLIVEEIDDWGPESADGARDGLVTVSILDAPLTMKGTLRLRPADSGSVATLDADLVATIPLIGSKIEKAAAPAILAAVKSEEKTARTWLAEH